MGSIPAERSTIINNFSNVMNQQQRHSLDYAPKPANNKVRDWMLLTILSIILLILEPSGVPTPPGWPVFQDYAAMIYFWIGAIVLAVFTTLPSRILIWYGLFGSCLFLYGATTNTRLGLYLADEDRTREFILNWIMFISGSTFFCWATVLLRFFRRKTKE